MCRMIKVKMMLEDFNGWSDVMSSELADVEWHLSEEAMDSISHRF